MEWDWPFRRCSGGRIVAGLCHGFGRGLWVRNVGVVGAGCDVVVTRVGRGGGIRW